MTIVNTETGELIEPMSPDAARRLTERIRLMATTYTETKAKLMMLVEEAKAGHAHTALGYDSWTAYLSDVLSDEPLRLARDERRPLTRHLLDEGMSTRAIGSLLGVDQKTVVNDDRATTEEVSSVPQSPAGALDAHPVTNDRGRAGDVSDAGTSDVASPPAPRPQVSRTVMGLDGKERTYSTTPKAPSRRALPDVARDLGIDLRKLTDRFERLADDDRFGRNKNEVAAHLRHHLAHALKVLTDLEQEINSQQESNNV